MAENGRKASKTDDLKETGELLDRGERLGLTVKEVAGILEITPQRIYDYRSAVRSGTGDAMPYRSRRLLDQELRRREQGDSSMPPSGQGDPVQEALTALQVDVMRLRQLTQARGQKWDAMRDYIGSLLRIAEDLYGPGDEARRESDDAGR